VNKKIKKYETKGCISLQEMVYMLLLCLREKSMLFKTLTN